MKYILSIVLSAFLVITVAGCGQKIVNHGHQLNDKVLNRLVENTATKRDVLQMLGSPSAFGALDPHVWIYPSLQTSKRPVAADNLEAMRTLVLTFNEAGLLIKKEMVNQNDPMVATPLEKTTPTHGQSLGIIDQMLGNIGGGSF